MKMFCRKIGTKKSILEVASFERNLILFFYRNKNQKLVCFSGFKAVVFLGVNGILFEFFLYLLRQTIENCKKFSKYVPL